MGVGNRRCDRLIDFMGNGSRQLSHRRDAVRARQLHLCFVVTPLAPSEIFLCLLALSQIEHERNALFFAFAESRRDYQHGHAGPVLPVTYVSSRGKGQNRDLRVRSVGC